jgi:hypothetical protein
MGITPEGTPSFLSLKLTEQVYPDHDYPSTADNLWHYGADEETPCFTLDVVPENRIHPGQLLDDPDATESQAKVESIQDSIQRGDPLPPVYLLHTLRDGHEYYLFEGMHRFTASHRQQAEVRAWIAHLGCCGGPVAKTRRSSDG